MASFQEMSEKVKGTNINPKTLLATDYLNHFNEIIMLIEMVPDMPDMLEECKLWQPKTYEEHFAGSTFTHKDLAIEAYAYVPRNYKKAFEYATGEINRIILQSMAKMEEMKDDPDRLREFAKTTFKDLRTLIEATSSVINGTAAGSSTQSAADTIIGG